MSAIYLRRASAWQFDAAGLGSLLGFGLVAVALAHHTHGSRLDTHFMVEAGWLATVMMTPKVIPTLQVLFDRSFANERVRTLTAHYLGYAAVWFAFGCLALIVTLQLSPVARLGVYSGAGVTAAWWQLRERRTWMIDTCRPIGSAQSSGVRGTGAHAVFGVKHGVRCLETCGLAMVAMAAAPHPAWMLLLWANAQTEWLSGPNPFALFRRSRIARAYLAILASSLAVVALGKF